MKEIVGHRIAGLHGQLEVKAMDAPGPGGAHHWYEARFEQIGNVSMQRIRFQKGPIGEVGVNGVTNEVLLALVIDRLEAFQAGPFACEENARALEGARTALTALKERTINRMARGVEGANVK